MADPARAARRPLLVGGALAVVLLLVVLARGPLALVAAASVAVLAGFVLAVPPLLRHDGIDWDWLPHRDHDVPSEPGIALLRRLLAPKPDDTAAPQSLQALVRAIAEDRAEAGDLGHGALAAYLGQPPRRLDLAEVDAIITELEALPTKESA